MNSLFDRKIENWADWSGVYQDISAWRPLIEYIFGKEKLIFSRPGHLTAGTNAVFKVGGYAVKIFAPKESGLDGAADMQTELFAVRRSAALGVSTPALAAYGVVADKYNFSYIITEFINGREFDDISTGFSAGEKIEFGKKLRALTDRMNTPCGEFNKIDVINDVGRYRRWDKYPDMFKRERLEYIKSYHYGEKVFVHGDLCGDNILINGKGELYIIDFADAVTAPVIYEHAHIASELFRFDKSFITGYFGGYDAEKLSRLCFDGLLIHDFGGDIIKEYSNNPQEIDSLGAMRRIIDNACRTAGKPWDK